MAVNPPAAGQPPAWRELMSEPQSGSKGFHKAQFWVIIRPSLCPFRGEDASTKTCPSPLTIMWSI